MKKYFVSFVIPRGQGNHVVSMDGEIAAIEDIREIEKLIKEKNPELGNPVIINIIPLSTNSEEIEKAKKKEADEIEELLRIAKEILEREAAIEYEARAEHERAQDALGWYCFIPGSGQPTVVHDSWDSAENEAARLLAETGQTVQILEVKKELSGEFNRRVKLLMSAIKADACQSAIERIVRLVEEKGIQNISERDIFDDDWDWFIEHVPQD